MSEVELVEPSARAVADDGRRGWSSWLGRRPVLWGSTLLVAGIGAVVASLVATTAATGAPRYVLLTVGLAATYVGGDLLSRPLFGDAVDLDLWLSAAWLVLVVGAAALAPLLPLAESRDVSKALTEPIKLRPDLLSSHPLGTDNQGLDLLGGIVYGGRVSMVIGVGGALIGMLVGVSIGLCAGYFRGRIDTAVSFLTDSMLAFPPLIFLLAMAAAFTPSIGSVTFALAVLAIPTFIRLSRANTLVFAQREFVLAARALGARNRSVLTRDLLPNVLLPVTSFAFLLVAAFIVAEASLSFLGLSVSRPNPTWGNMIAAGQNEFEDTPHLVFVPGIVLFLTVFSLNRVGDFARSRWDPREAKV